MKTFSANEELLKKSGTTLGEWLGLNEQARELKLKFGQIAK